MAKSDHSKTVTPTPVVEDPHPGSISDGTHPSAMERKQPKPTKGRGDSGRVKSTTGGPELNEGQTDINSAAPKHPNKGAYGS
nr:hypothetical protein [uncultured Shinella sp.]